MAFYSQVSDEVRDFEAVPLSMNAGKHALLDSAENYYRVATGKDVKPNDAIKWTLKANDTLHAMGGKVTEPRRSQLEKLMVNDDLTNAELGILIHSFGDTYSHSYDKDGTETMYNPIEGHGLRILTHGKDGSDVDAIGLNPTLYKKYISRLYTLLGGQGNAKDNPVLRSLFDKTNEFKGKFNGFRKYDFDGEIAAVRAFATDKYKEFDAVKYLPEEEERQLHPGKTKLGFPIPTRKQMGGVMGMILTGLVPENPIIGSLPALPSQNIQPQALPTLTPSEVKMLNDFRQNRK